MRLLSASALVVLLASFTVDAQAVNGPDPVCNTAACSATASEMLANMNPNADPCQDFYEFTCGGFMQSKTIPPGESAVTTWQFDRSNNVIRQILEADPKTLKELNGQTLDGTSLRNLNKIQGLYRSCMNETQLAAVGAKPLHEELQQLVTIIFSVPDSPLALVLSRGNSSSTPPPSSSNSTAPTERIDRESLTAALAHFVLGGVDALVAVAVNEDALEPTTQTVMIMEKGLSLPARELYQEPSLMQVFQNVIQQMFTLVLGSGQNDIATKLAQDVVTFESQLANISSSTLDQNNIAKMWNPMSVRQLSQLNPAIDWPLFLDKTLGANNQYPQDKNLTVTSLPYHEKLVQLLSQTSPVTLQSYFAWKTIQARHGRLSQEFRAPMESILALVMGTDPAKPPERWKTCVQQASTNLGPLVGYFYVAQEFVAEDKRAMAKLIDSLKEVYLADMPDTTWLDNQTRANAMTKLKAIEPLIGYSTVDPNVGDPSDLNRYFAEVAIDEGDLYGNMDLAVRLSISKTLARANKKTERQRMFADPQTINAFYYPLTNQVLFPAAFLQKPLYTTGNPDYLTYGAIGVIAAHEITHGFDSSGRLFDESGKLYNWWTNETTEQFIARSQCFIDQYSKFTLTNPTTNQTLHVDGQLTLAENIADNGGLKRAYETWYQRFKSPHNPSSSDIGNNQILPGLEKYTRDQLFFISYGQVWCAKMTPEMDQQLLRTDTHAPARWRVNGPIQNTPAFAQAFKCSQGSPMNPANKCAIW